VGETRAAQPLVEALLAAPSGLRILMTHGTPTGRQTSEDLFGDRIQRGYLPYDLPWAVATFLAEQRPAAGLLMET
jgi:3-deoxy-D-manno-octulosonic-acid transferase